MTKTKEQFDRINRWFNLLNDINNGIKHEKESNYYQDIVYSFFQNCHHLKDWIVNDNNNNIPNKIVEEYINANLELKICADLCNGSKHLFLKPQLARSDKNTNINKKAFSLALPSNVLSIKYFVISGSVEYDAFEIATKCVNLWKKFLENNNII